MMFRNLDRIEKKKKDEWQLVLDTDPKLREEIEHARVLLDAAEPPPTPAAPPVSMDPDEERRKFLKGWVPPFGEYVITFKEGRTVPYRTEVQEFPDEEDSESDFGSSESGLEEEGEAEAVDSDDDGPADVNQNEDNLMEEN